MRRTKLIRRTPRHACRVVYSINTTDRTLTLCAVAPVVGPAPHVAHLIGEYQISDADTGARRLWAAMRGRIIARMREAAEA